MSNAGPVSACDPQGVAAALAVSQARLTEKTLNESSKPDSIDNEFAEYWTIPNYRLFKFCSGRLACVASESKACMNNPCDEFIRCVRFFLQLVQRAAPASVVTWDIQPSVLVSFCQSVKPLLQ